MEAHMRRLIGVAVISAVVGAASALWAESIIVGTSVKSANVAAARTSISPHEIMKSAKDLAVEVVEDLN
jgi:K+-sensing histidine kinase KdpD